MEGYKPPHEQPEEERQQKHIEAVEHEEERLELLEVEQGSTQDSLSEKKPQMTEPDAEDLRGWGKTGEELERWKREQGLS